MTSHRHFAALLIAVALVPSIPGVAEAQSPVTMSAGEEKEICSGVSAVAPDAAKYGTWRIKADDKDKTLVHVYYKANAVTAASEETVTCGPDKKTYAIKVAPAAASGSSSDTKTATTDSGTRNGVGFSDQTYPEAFKALFLMFVLATVLESALAILFNWRPFVERLNSRAVKPVVSFLFALAFVVGFNIDLITALAKLITPDAPKLAAAGPLLTAMVIAGGSAAVNNLMVALGFRQVRTPETVTPKPPANKGWISVSIVRTDAITGPVTVAIGVAAGGAVPVVASLERSTRQGWRYFLRDPGRFPGSGGYTVASGGNVTVEASAAQSGGGGNKVVTWGPHVIADGAIIDLTFTM